MEDPASVSSELPIHWMLQRPGFVNVQWNPKVPILRACLPLFVGRPFLRKHLTAEIERLIRFCSESIESVFMKEAQEALSRMGSEIEKRAGEIESRIIQAMKGRRLTKGIDGRWQVLELDTAELSHEIETLGSIEKKLGWIRAKMLEEISAPAAAPSADPVVNPADLVPTPAQKQDWLEQPFKEAVGAMKEKDSTDFARHLNTRGCPVCNRMIDAASRFFASWQYALATQEQAQQAHAASLGFCPLHTWQLEAIASPQGLSQGLPMLVERLSADLSRLAASETSNPGVSVPALVQSSKECRTCRLVQDTEKAYLKGLAGFVQSPGGHKAYTYSQGLCLRHLGLLIPLVASKEVVRFLLEHAARLFAQISEDMQNYALKRDALRRHIHNLDEEDAYLRGLIHSVGARRVCFPWEVDAEV